MILKDSLKLDSMGEHFSREEHPALACVGQEKAYLAKLLAVESWSLRSWDVFHTKFNQSKSYAHVLGVFVAIQALSIRSPADHTPRESLTGGIKERGVPTRR